MPSDHSKGEDNEEALKPEDDVIEEVHLSLKHTVTIHNITFLTIILWLNHHKNPHHHHNHHNNDNEDDLQAPQKLKTCQKEGDCHDTAKDEPAFLPDHDDDDDDDDGDDGDGDDGNNYDDDAKYLRS